MAAFEGSQRDRIRELERIVERQQANIDELYASVGQPVASPQVRIARVVEVTAFPDEGASVFGIVFLDGTYTETEGQQTPTWTARQSEAKAYACNLSQSGVINEDQEVTVFRQNGKWWIDTDGASSNIIRFEITGTKDYDGNVIGEQLTWGGATYAKTGTTIGLVDSVGKWGKGTSGYQGWAVACSDRDTVTINAEEYDAYEIVWMEGQARFGECVLTEDMGATAQWEAEAVTSTAGLKFWGAPPNHHDPPSPITLLDRYHIGKDLESTTKCLYLYDELLDEYVLLAPHSDDGKVKVDASDDLDYLEDQFEDLTTDDYAQATDATPIFVDNVTGTDDGTPQLQMYLPFNEIASWNAGQEQWLENYNGTVRWYVAGQVKVDSSDSLDYLEDQFDDLTTDPYVQATDATRILVDNVAGGDGTPQLQMYLPFDTIASWNPGQEQYLQNYSGTVRWSSGTGSDDGRVKVDASDDLAYLEDQFENLTASAYNASTDGAPIFVDNVTGTDDSTPQLQMYLPFDAISGWSAGLNQTLYNYAGTIQWDAAGTVKVAASDTLNYLEEQFEDHTTDAYAVATDGTPVLVDTITGTDDSTPQLQLYIPFDSVSGWDAAKEQWFSNTSGTVQWEDAGKVKADIDDTLAYLEDQFEDLTVNIYDALTDGTPVLVDNVNHDLKLYLPFDLITGYSPSSLQMLVNDSGTLKWMNATQQEFCTDIQVSGVLLQWKYQNAYVVKLDAESAWTTWHTGTNC